MTQRSTLAPEGPVQAFEPSFGRFYIFYATQRPRCHNQRYVLLSRFEGIDAAESHFSTHILIKEGTCLDILSCVKHFNNRIAILFEPQITNLANQAGLENLLALVTIEVRKSQHVCKFEEALGLASHLTCSGN